MTGRVLGGAHVAAGLAWAAGAHAEPPVPPQAQGTGSFSDIAAWLALVVLVGTVVLAWRRTRAWIDTRLDPLLERLAAAAQRMEESPERLRIRAWLPEGGDAVLWRPVLGERWLRSGHLHLLVGAGPLPVAEIVADLLDAPAARVGLASLQMGCTDVAGVLRARGRAAAEGAAGRLFEFQGDVDLAEGASALLDDLVGTTGAAALVVDMTGEDPASQALIRRARAWKDKARDRGVLVLLLVPSGEEGEVVPLDLEALASRTLIRRWTGERLVIAEPDADEHVA